MHSKPSKEGLVVSQFTSVVLRAKIIQEPQTFRLKTIIEPSCLKLNIHPRATFLTASG